jgi:hypothetical protein
MEGREDGRTLRWRVSLQQLQMADVDARGDHRVATSLEMESSEPNPRPLSRLVGLLLASSEGSNAVSKLLRHACRNQVLFFHPGPFRRLLLFLKTDNI